MSNTPILSDFTQYNNLYYLSGQVGTDPATGAFAGDTVEAQAAQAAKNLEAVLNRLGMDLNNVIRATCYLTDMANYGKFNEEYAKHFVSRPARTCIAVKALPFGALCEIEVIAVKNT